MIKLPSISKLSFRTKALLVSFALQSLFVCVFATSVLYFVADRGAAALKENLEAATEGYARNAAFVFIGSLEANRSEFLTAASGSPNIDAAFLMSPDFEFLAITNENWRASVSDNVPQSRPPAEDFIVEEAEYWLFFEPVYAVDRGSCTDFATTNEECAASPELLGYLGVVGSKDLIKSVFRRVAVIVIGAAIVLLALIYWVTNRLADRLYGPMLALADRTMTAADHGFRDKLKFSGPVEVENVAAAINHLIDRAAENAGQLEKIVAEKTKEEREAREEAEAARAFAERVKEWRTDLMAVNTHELLTPLRILIGELDRAIGELRFLDAGRTRDAIAKRLKQMRTPIQRIEEIVEQVNIAMRIEEGRVEVRPGLSRLAPMLERLEALYAPEALRRNNRLTVRCEVDEALVTDHRMIETIASNLMSNACKFTRNGEVELRTTAALDKLEIVCADTGMGIPENRRAMIFEPLYQADMSSRRVADGLGLGLSIVKGYVDRLGGEIVIESGEGSGTIVRVRVPLSKSTPQRDNRNSIDNERAGYDEQ